MNCPWGPSSCVRKSLVNLLNEISTLQKMRHPYSVDQTIVDEAQKAGADMIVMVTHGRSRVGKFVFGSHTKNVIIESPLPVLVLH